jgi:hypothetical protein
LIQNMGSKTGQKCRQETDRFEGREALQLFLSQS